MNGFEIIRGKEMYCCDCQQDRDTNFVPVRLVSTKERVVEAHTIQVCGFCSSFDLRPVQSDLRIRMNDASFRWKK